MDNLDKRIETLEKEQVDLTRKQGQLENGIVRLQASIETLRIQIQHLQQQRR